jgi:glycosyltransferase involved in cell wall biosynthesis
MKKVLIITYSWYPCGGVNVLRNLKFAKYLKKFNWEPIIFTAENPDYPSIDYSNEKDVPKNIKIIKQKIFEPYAIFKFLTFQKSNANHSNPISAYSGKRSLVYNISLWIRSNIFIPDARSMWISGSVNKLLAYCIDNKIDAIYSDGPPHTNTRIATLLKKALHKKNINIPWLCDFQDPWTTVDYFPTLPLTKWGLNKHKKMEKEAFETCDTFTTVSQSWANDLKTIGAPNPEVLYYGFDEDDFINKEKKTDKIYTIVHAGMLSKDRIPHLLFESIAKIKNANIALHELFQIHLYGAVDIEAIELIQKLQIDDIIQLKGNIARNEMIQKIVNAHQLLLLINNADNSKGRIPAKLFEYLAAENPILCVGNSQSDVANIIHECNAGEVFDYNFDMNNYLNNLINNIKNNQLKTYNINTNKVKQFSNYNQTKKLAEILNNMQNNATK